MTCSLLVFKNIWQKDELSQGAAVGQTTIWKKASSRLPQDFFVFGGGGRFLFVCLLVYFKSLI